MAGPWTCVLCDPAPVLADTTALRQLKEIGQRATPGQTLLLVGHAMAIPPDLDDLILRLLGDDGRREAFAGKIGCDDGLDFSSGQGAVVE